MSAFFSYRLLATDGGPPIDLLEYPDEAHDSACVYRRDDVLGAGPRLLDAWDEFLYSVSPNDAPVEADALDEMWRAYDEWREETPTPTEAE